MKKQTLILVALLLCVCGSVWAQKEYKITKTSGRLHLNLHSARIEGYDGNQIIITSEKSEEEKDERAKGLQAISSSGYTDNTGMGINVTENGPDVVLNQIGNNRSSEGLRIRVPKKLAVSFTNSNSIFADTVLISNMKSEIEVSTSYNSVILKNNSGPMNIKAVYRDVVATFEQDIRGPVSIISVYGHVDVALPATTKANLTLGTSYGKLYAASDFNIAMNPKKVETEARDSLAELVASALEVATDLDLSGDSGVTVVPRPPSPPHAPAAITVTGFKYKGNQEDSIDGKINGGGLDLILKSTYKNVYLRIR